MKHLPAVVEALFPSSVPETLTKVTVADGWFESEKKGGFKTLRCFLLFAEQESKIPEKTFLPVRYSSAL